MTKAVENQKALKGLGSINLLYFKSQGLMKGALLYSSHALYCEIRKEGLFLYQFSMFLVGEQS